MTHPRSRACRALAVLTSATLLALGPAQAGDLSFESALRLSESRSADLSARRAAEQSTRELVVTAGRRPDPVLQAGVNNLPVNGADAYSLTRDFMTMRYVGVMQEWTRSDKLAARTAKAERDVDIAALQVTLGRMGVQRETALAWLERYYRDRVVILLARQVDEARLQVQTADVAVRGGRGSAADAIAARAAVAQAEDRLAEARRDVATATIRLARWVGVDVGAVGPLPDLGAISWHHVHADDDLTGHPELTLLAAQEQQARADLDAMRTERRADPSVQLMYSQRGPGYSNMVSVGVSIPWPWDAARRQDRQVAAKEAELEQRRAEREEAARVHAAEVRATSAEWDSARDRLRRYDLAILPLAEDRVAASLASYRGGTATLASLLEARRALVDSQMERLRLELEAARLWAQLEFMVPHDLAVGTPPGERP